MSDAKFPARPLDELLSRAELDRPHPYGRGEYADRAMSYFLLFGEMPKISIELVSIDDESPTSS